LIVRRRGRSVSGGAGISSAMNGSPIMNLEFRTSNLQSSSPLEAHVVRKLDFALRRFSDRVERVLVRLVDINGPRGGSDKRCRIAASLSGAPSVIVEATHANAYVAITHATARLHTQVARMVAMHGWALACRLDQRRALKAVPAV
jgi:putative sigma-54 modulation protein